MVSEEHKRAQQRRYNRNWYARYMSDPEVRKRHYQQNMKWYAKHRNDAEQAMNKSAFVTWFMFTTDADRLKHIAQIASKRLKSVRGGHPIKLSRRPRKKVPLPATMSKYYTLIRKYLGKTRNRELLKLAKARCDKRLKAISKS